MAIALVKRGNTVELTKGGNLKRINIALGWEENDTGSYDFDPDVSAFLVNSNGKVRDDGDFIFYGNLKHDTGAVVHSGDDRTGAAEGDNEVIAVDFSKVPSHVDKIVFTVTIYEAERRSQNFGMMENSYVRLDNADTGEQLIKYELGEDFSLETGVVVCELYRHNGDWKFTATGAGISGGLAALVKSFGLEVA